MGLMLVPVLVTSTVAHGLRLRNEERHPIVTRRRHTSVQVAEGNQHDAVHNQPGGKKTKRGAALHLAF